MYSEQELINGCVSNKREFQKLLYQKFAGKMLSLCFRYFKNREEAEDVLQDGFIKIFKNIDKYQGTGSFEGWIKRIMVNTALEELRKKKKEFITQDIDELYIQPESVDKTDDSVNTKDLIRYIQALPEGYKLVFNLFVIEGYSHGEIGQMLNINEGTSKSQLSKARAYLQKMMSEQDKIQKTEIVNVSSNERI
ncbi:MAG: RNA polymerase sigma factor [Bacteroidia bacterium]